MRIGLQEDFGEALLPEVLGRFARAHPKVRIEARIERNAALIERVASGRLDLALAWSYGAATPAHGERLMETPMRWIGPADPRELARMAGGSPLPLAALEAPCMLRNAAADALDRAGVAWRLAFTSPSLSGLWAAVAAGLGLSVRTPLGLPASVRALDPEEGGLPPLPQLGLALLRADAVGAPATERLAEILVQALRGVNGAEATASRPPQGAL